MKGVSIINDETHNRRYIQIELSALKEFRKKGEDVMEFIEDIEDMIDAELSANEEGEDWEVVKQRLKNKGRLSDHV